MAEAVVTVYSQEGARKCIEEMCGEVERDGGVFRLSLDDWTADEVRDAAFEWIREAMCHGANDEGDTVERALSRLCRFLKNNIVTSEELEKERKEAMA